MSRLNKDRQELLEPKRIETAKVSLQSLGFEICFESETEIRFFYKNEEVKFFPYSGWHTGKSIQDGRGLQNLLKQIK